MKTLPANILTAHLPASIGTRVTDLPAFMAVLGRAIEEHDFSKDEVPGQGFLMIPDAVPLVSAGVGARTTDPADYVCRVHRGVVSAFLKREKAATVEGCAAIVYTLEAYLADPDVLKEPEEAARVVEAGASHVLVAVLAFAGPKPPLTPHRFVANLAGGNNEALAWTADQIREIAKGVLAYDDAWCVVAD